MANVSLRIISDSGNATSKLKIPAGSRVSLYAIATDMSTIVEWELYKKEHLPPFSEMIEHGTSFYQNYALTIPLGSFPPGYKASYYIVVYTKNRAVQSNTVTLETFSTSSSTTTPSVTKATPKTVTNPYVEYIVFGSISAVIGGGILYYFLSRKKK